MSAPALRVAAASLSLAALLTATACVPDPAPSPTATPVAEASPTPTPTPSAFVVGPGEKPPVVFDQDCDAAVPAADLTALLGSSMSLVASESGGDLGNVGGLACRWEGDGTSVTLEVIPQSALGEMMLSAGEQEYYFEDCDPGWVCGWNGETADLWIAVSFQLSQGMTRQAVDEWGAEIGAGVDERFAASEAAPWERDHTGWWPVLDCAAVAANLGDALGAEFAGESVGYPDPPRPGYALAALASYRSGCLVSDLDAAVRPIEMYTTAGTAWTLPALPEDEPVEAGVTGVSAWRDSGYESIDSAGYSLTDGVNSANIYLPTTGPWASEQLLTAVAELAASGWQ